METKRITPKPPLPDRPLTSDDELVAITQAAVEEMGFKSELNYWNDYNPSPSWKPRGLIAVLGIQTTTRDLPVAKLEIRVEKPHWVILAVIFDDGGCSFRKKDQIDLHNPESFRQLKDALTARARVQLGDPDFVP